MRPTLAGLMLWFAAAPVPAADPQRAKDHFGDPLPEGATLRLGTTRLRAQISSFGILPDGTVVTVSPKNEVRTWGPKDDESDFAIPIPIPGSTAHSAHPQVSPDGRFIAGNSTTKVFVWERPTDLIKQVAAFEIEKPRYLLFSPEGSKLAVSHTTERAERMCLCDVKSGKLAELTGEPSYFECMAFSGDGKRLVASSGYETFVWETENGKELARYKTGKQRYSAIALNSSGSIMAVVPTWGEQIVFIDPLTGKEIEKLTKAPRGSPIAFAADGKSLLISNKSGVTWWDPIVGKELRMFAGMAFSGYGGLHPSAQFTPDGKTLVATSGEILLRWDAATGKSLFPEAQDGGHHYQVWGVGASTDGKYIATAGHDDLTRLWDAATGKSIRSFPSRWMNERNVEFSPDGMYLFMPSEDRKTVVKWDVETGKVAKRFGFKLETPPIGGMISYGLSGDGKTVFAAFYGENSRGTGLFIGWDAEKGGIRQHYEIKDSNLLMFPIGTFSPDGKVFGSEFGLHAVGDPMKKILPDRKRRGFDHGTFTPDGKGIAFCEYDHENEEAVGSLVVYDLSTGKKTLETPIERYAHCGFSPDGKTIAAAGAKALVFLDAATGKEFARLKAPFGNSGSSHASFARAVRFTPDGKRVLTTHNDTAPLVWTMPLRPGKK